MLTNENRKRFVHGCTKATLSSSSLLSLLISIPLLVLKDNDRTPKTCTQVCCAYSVVELGPKCVKIGPYRLPS